MSLRVTHPMPDCCATSFSNQNRNCFHLPWNDASFVVWVHWRQLGLLVPQDVATLEPVKPKRSNHENCGIGWSLSRCYARRGHCDDVWRAPTARCLRCAHTPSAREMRPCWRGRRPDVRVCEAVHQRGMTRRFGTRWIRRRNKMDGCHETSGTGPARTRRFPTAHLDPAALAVLDLRLSTTKRLMGSARLRRGASRRKLGATSLRHSRRHQGLRRESLAALQWHTLR